MKIVRKECVGRVLNACAGKTTIEHSGAVVRNDINPDRDADTHVDVCEIADHFASQSFDTILFDPPFDEQQAEEKYDGMHAMDVYAALEQFNELVRPGGKVVCFGWNSWGMESFGAFERSRTLLLGRGPIHRDVIVTVDVRTSGQLGGPDE
jgi:threonine dehydrogenase-like Zn-dependent dehydrogenase